MAASAIFAGLRDGNLPYFQPVSSFPGFARSVASTITELRLAGVPEGELRAAAVTAHDIAHLLSKFNEQLDAQHASDLADLFRVAAAAVTADDVPLRGVPIVLLDVPVRTAVERAFVRPLLADRDVCATAIPADTPTNAFLMTCGLTETPAQATPTTSSLERLRAYLFAPTSEEAHQDETVAFSSAPGEAREAVEMARRIHAEARRGVPYDDIAILLRSPRQYMPHVETALRRAGIPYYPARSVARPDPGGRAFLAVLVCAAEDYSA